MPPDGGDGAWAATAGLAWPRALVKQAVLTLINARTPQAAHLAIAHCEHMVPLAVPGSNEAKQKATDLIGAIKIMHAPISHAFHSDEGARLMALDSAIAEAVMNSLMLTKGIVVLPVHDSFVVPASKRDELEEAMIEAANRIAGWTATVEAK